ncbi:MAG: R3H domain-containing nucleic acid-binding protein [Spiroplasma sp.]
MEVKVFKKNIELDNFIKKLDSETFYKLLSNEKGLFRTINKILVFTNKDVEEYLIIQFHKILEIFAIKDFHEKIYLTENKFYIKFNCERDNSFLLKKYGYVISAIQNLLISYIFNKFSKWYQIQINVNNHLHNQKYFFKKQIYFAIKNIKETNKPFHFKPMPNDQRKIVHKLVKEIDGFSSFSQGNGFLRHIVIIKEE